MTQARALIARTCLDDLPPASLGAIQLRDGQRRLVVRAVRAIESWGGCLVAEEVGAGKTFIALAVACRWQHPLVVAPAALRSTWRVAAEQAGVAFTFASMESLSRCARPVSPFDGVIVDESHHFRTITTQRYTALADLCACTPLLLLSATPLQNRLRDLAAQVALFIGERAFGLDGAALSRFVVRSNGARDAEMPLVRAPEWLSVVADDSAVLEAILALPPPAQPLDGGDAGALRTLGLVRAWSSSRAALRAMLRTRRRLATAIAQGTDAGRAPTRKEARAWHAAEGVVQLGFATLLFDSAPAQHALDALRAAVEADARSMDHLFALLATTPDPDHARIVAIRRLRATYPDVRILCFSDYASTVLALFGALRLEPGVGMLTARDARIATGRISRDDLLARFAPRAQHARAPRAHERVTLLLATDLLSEGVNLQDAGIVLHLDLPWNPARMAQRVGRLRRPGGVAEVRSLLLAPPAGAAVLVDAERRLRRKLSAAGAVVGASFQILPSRDETSAAPASPLELASRSAIDAHSSSIPPHRADSMRASGDDTQWHSDDGTSSRAGAVLSHLEKWIVPVIATPAVPGVVIAAVESSERGWLAMLRDGRLVSCRDGVVSDAAHDALPLVLRATGSARTSGSVESDTASAALRQWLVAEHALVTCGLAAPPTPLRRAVTDWLARTTHSLQRHERAVASPLVTRLRERLLDVLPLGAERALAEHARVALPFTVNAVNALARAVQLVDACPVRGASRERDTTSTMPVAMILFGPATPTP